jgi:hypothetical protein
MPEEKFLGLNTAIFDITDYIPADAQFFTKCPLGQLKRLPHSSDSIEQITSPLQRFHSSYITTQKFLCQHK